MSLAYSFACSMVRTTMSRPGQHRTPELGGCRLSRPQLSRDHRPRKTRLSDLALEGPEHLSPHSAERGRGDVSVLPPPPLHRVDERGRVHDGCTSSLSGLRDGEQAVEVNGHWELLPEIRLVCRRDRNDYVMPGCSPTSARPNDRLLT